jgi:hypothetical protein
MCSALVSLACASAFGTTIYKWVDEKGVTHYSDQPHADAKTIELKSAQTYQADVSATSATSGSTAQPNSVAPYSVCELYRPENDEVFLNTATVTAKLRVNPGLRPDDHVALALDGQRLTNQPSTGTDFVLTQVTRGTHSLTAVIEDSTGKPVCISPAVTFHVRQPSTQAPNRANRPRF